jgi:hypothetical protein
MKKFLLVLFVGVLVCGFAAAQEEGLGLTGGLELGFGDVADGIEMSLTPQVGYEGSFLEGALDVSAELDYTFIFASGAPMALFAEENVGYNFFLGEASTLTGTVHHENSFNINPFSDGDDGSVVEPSVSFAQGFNAGDLGITVGFPIAYLPSAEFGLYVTAGFGFPFGFGVEVTANFDLSSPEYADTNLVLSYGHDIFSIEVEIDAEDKSFKTYALSPLVEFYINAFTIWAGADIGGLGGKVSAEPFLGASISF